MAVTLYHLRHDNGDTDKSQPMLKHGRTFRPQPTAEQMQKLKKAGWKESPHELPGYVHPPSAQDIPDYDLFLDEGDELEDMPEDDTRLGTAPPVVPQDIRAIPAPEAVIVINTISDKKTLNRINKREAAGARPRKSVLNAIAARLEQL